MRKSFYLTINFSLLLLLCGFSWSALTWEIIDATIDRKFPDVKNIDTDTLNTLINQGKNLVLIDVREKSEFAVSNIPTAINIPRVDDVLFKKDALIIVYCSVGLRSANFAQKLTAHGFTKILNLRGSIFQWGNKGYPLQRGETTVKAVHPYNNKWGQLLNPKLRQYQVISSDKQKTTP
jgi:rhodanese-related sulfurtransferase